MATVYKAYYKSPIGFVKITADKQFVTKLVFIDEDTSLVNHTDAIYLLPLQQCLQQLMSFLKTKEQILPLL